jgi:hypothetical protein
MAASGALASAQTVAFSLRLANPGPITSCTPNAPVLFAGTIDTANWPAGPRQIQYKWTFSDLGDQPTLTANVPSTGATASVPVTFFGWSNHSAGGWAEIVVSYPVNVTSGKLNWKLVCPNVGSLSVPPTLLQTDLVPGLQLAH